MWSIRWYLLIFAIFSNRFNLNQGLIDRNILLLIFTWFSLNHWWITHNCIMQWSHWISFFQTTIWIRLILIFVIVIVKVIKTLNFNLFCLISIIRGLLSHLFCHCFIKETCWFLLLNGEIFLWDLILNFSYLVIQRLSLISLYFSVTLRDKIFLIFILEIEQINFTYFSSMTYRFSMSLIRMINLAILFF